MNDRERLSRVKSQLLARRREHFSVAIDVSRRIFSLAELSGAEVASRDTLLAALSEVPDVTVATGLGSFHTGMTAAVGNGDVHIALFAEYDALPVLGHACGHNLISGAAVLAFHLLSPLCDAMGMRVSLFGTPSEERGMAKVVLLEEGMFNGIDAALACHPAAIDCDAPTLSALARWRIAVDGESAGHSATFNTSGLSAAEAFGLIQTALQYSRRRLGPGQHIDLEMSSGSGVANVQLAQGTYDAIVRARNSEDLETAGRVLVDLLAGCGRALDIYMTISESQPRTSPLMNDPNLTAAWAANRRIFGMQSHPMNIPVASDIGPLSERIPCIMPFFDIGSFPAVNHQPEFAAAAAGISAERSMLRAGTLLALTALDFVNGGIDS